MPTPGRGRKRIDGHDLLPQSVTPDKIMGLFVAPDKGTQPNQPSQPVIPAAPVLKPGLLPDIPVEKLPPIVVTELNFPLITETMLANGAVNLGNDAVVTGTLAATHLIAEDVAANIGSFLTLNANQLVAGAIDAAVIDVTNLKAENIVSGGTISAPHISGGSIEGANVTILAALGGLNFTEPFAQVGFRIAIYSTYSVPTKTFELRIGCFNGPTLYGSSVLLATWTLP